MVPVHQVRAAGVHGVPQFDLERLQSYVEADQVGKLVGGQPAQGPPDLVSRSDPGKHRAVLRHGTSSSALRPGRVRPPADGLESRADDADVLYATVANLGNRHIFRSDDGGLTWALVSEDQGGTWTNLTRNHPNVMVVDLAYHEMDRTLTAATNGRSVWRLQVD